MNTGQLTPTQSRHRHSATVATVDDALIWLSQQASAYRESRGWWTECDSHPQFGRCVIVTIEGTPTGTAVPAPILPTEIVR